MKRSGILAMLLVGITTYSSACDACGCAVGGPGIGVYTAFYSNFVRVGWQYSGFEAVKQFGEGSQDQFHSLNISGRIQLSPRFKLLFNQPYRINVRHDGPIRQELHGISDGRLLAGYTVLQDLAIGEWSNLFLEVAAGVEFPFGKYDPDLRTEDILPENFNIGSGSWDFVLQANSALKVREFGLILSGSYQRNGRSPDEYQFGDQFTAQGMVYWEKTFKSGLKIIPSAGVYYESIRDDLTPAEIPMTATGGSGVFGSFGVNFSTPRLLWGVTFSPVLSQDYSDGEVLAADRLNAHISYVF